MPCEGYRLIESRGLNFVNNLQGLVGFNKGLYTFHTEVPRGNEYEMTEA